MSFVTQEIASLTGGVSQAPAQRRLDSQLEALVNGWVEATRGLGKRPPSTHIAQLDSDNTLLGVAFLHTINRDEDERYRVIIEDSDLKVYNEAGVEQSVTFPHGKTYLDESTPKSAFRAVTVGDQTFVANNTQEISKSTSLFDQSPKLANEALIWIREGDFSTNYFCVFGVPIGDREYTTYDATITSGAGTGTAERNEYDSKAIATKMYNKMVGTGSQDLDMTSNGWTVTAYNTVIHVKRNDGGDFKVAAGEGLEGNQDLQLDVLSGSFFAWATSARRKAAQTADRNIMVAIKDTVGRIEDLPPNGPEGFRTQVVGHESTEWDNYWYVFSDGGWVECIAPGEVTALDPDTMPHQLLRSTLIYERMVSVNGPVPVVTSEQGGSTEKTETGFWEQLNDGGAAHDVNHPLSTQYLDSGVAFENSFVNMNDADGAETEYVFTYTIDCTNLGSEMGAQVQLYVNDGVSSTSWTLFGIANMHTVADGIVEDTITVTGTIVQNYDIKIVLDTRFDWESGKYAKLTPTSIVFAAQASNTKKIIDLHEDRLYPKGTVVTATVNANPNAHTVTGDDETADEVATALEILIEDDSGITATVVNGHTIEVEHTTTTPTVTIASTYDASKTVILDREYGFAADVLATLTAENRTDLSSHVITTNGTRSITCASALTGGTDNEYQSGDLVRVVTGTSLFSFSRINWDRRAVGDERSNPWPSFVGKKITEVFFHSGRLGFTHMESVVLSRAGELTNFFRKTARQLLDGDQIDVTYAGRGSSLIHSAVETNTQMVFFTELGQLHLQGEPTLTPRTAELIPWTYYENTDLVRPLPYGDKVMFLQADGGATQAFAYSWREAQLPTGDPLGEHTPSYMVGNPLAWAISSQHKMVAVLTDADQSMLYIGRLVETRDGVDAAWMKWQYGINDIIIGIDVIDDTLGLVVVRDEGLFLETINIMEKYDSGLLLDRKMDQDDMTSLEWVTGERIDQDMTYSDGVDLYNLIWIAGASAGFFKIRSNEVYAHWSGQHVWGNGYCYKGGTYSGDVLEATGTYDVSMKMTRGAGVYTNGCALDFFMAENSNACVEYCQLQVLKVDDDTVTVKFWYHNGGDDYAEVLTTTLALAYGASLVFGVSIDQSAANSARFEAWHEPVGGGTRTSLGFWTNYAGSYHNSGSHKKVGFSFNGGGHATETTWTWDDLVVLRTDIVDSTLITLPFDIPAGDGTLMLIKKSDESEYTFTRPTDGTITVPNFNLTAVDFWLGWLYTWTAQLTEIFNRHWRTGMPVLGGQLQLGNVMQHYSGTRDFTVTVTVNGVDYTYTVDEAAVAESAVRFPVSTAAKSATIVYTNATVNPVWLQGVSWEGTYSARGRKL